MLSSLNPDAETLVSDCAGLRDAQGGHGPAITTAGEFKTFGIRTEFASPLNQLIGVLQSKWRSPRQPQRARRTVHTINTPTSAPLAWRGVFPCHSIRRERSLCGQRPIGRKLSCLTRIIGLHDCFIGDDFENNRLVGIHAVETQIPPARPPPVRNAGGCDANAVVGWVNAQHPGRAAGKVGTNPQLPGGTRRLRRLCLRAEAESPEQKQKSGGAANRTVHGHTVAGCRRESNPNEIWVVAQFEFEVGSSRCDDRAA